MKRQPSEWEKIIENEASDKQRISNIYKQLLQLNSRKINDPIKKSLEKEMATHSSTLAWRIPWREEPGRLPSMESHRVGHD